VVDLFGMEATRAYFDSSKVGDVTDDFFLAIISQLVHPTSMSGSFVSGVQNNGLNSSTLIL
jgi:hypothetical protein